MPHGNPAVGFSNAPWRDLMVVRLGWNSPLAYICRFKGDNSVKILQSRINGGSAARRLITRGSTSLTFSLLHFHACVYFLVIIGEHLKDTAVLFISHVGVI